MSQLHAQLQLLQHERYTEKGARKGEKDEDPPNGP